MSDREFHQLMAKLTKDCPNTIKVVRVMCALQVAIKAGGEPVAKAVRDQVNTVVDNVKDSGQWPKDSQTLI